MLTSKVCKQLVYKSCRVLLVTIVLLTLVSLIRYIWNDNIYTNSGLTVNEDRARIKTELDAQVNDLKNTKQSLQNELSELQTKKNFILSEIERLEETKGKENSKITDMQKMKALYDGNLKLDELNYTLETCFTYSKCPINSKINVYFHNNDFLQLENSVDNVFVEVNNPNDSCLAIYFVKNQADLNDVFENIEKIRETNHNLLLINLVNDNNLFVEALEMNDTILNYLKSTLYASFNYYSNNEFYKDRFSSLFFHFSLLSLNMSKDLTNIYKNQRQNRLLLTYRRKILLTYFESTNTKVKREVKKNFNMLNCDILDNSCIRSIKILDALSNSSYVLIDNKHASDSTLWSNDLTHRLIEALSVGTIPVISDLDSKLPLSDLINWNEIVVRCPVNQAYSYETLLNSISEADLVNRRIKATKIFKRYFKTPQAQFNTLITAIRERLRLPPAPIESYVVDDIDKLPTIDYDNQTIDMSLYTDKSIRVNHDEYLGPVTKDAEELQLHQSKSYQFNRTFGSYSSWNHQFYPFNMMPSTPFDKFLPIDTKYTSIKSPTNPSPNYFYGGTKGGEHFHDRLGGNDDDNEQFTIIILTFNRERLLISVLLEYFKLPYLNQIIVVWNSIDTKPSDTLYMLFDSELKNRQLRIVFGKKNSLMDRFLPYEFIKTDAVMSLDDDTQLRNDEIIFAFRVWRENRDRLVGFPARFHSWNPSTKQFEYRTQLSCEYSLILTGAAIYHRYYHYYFHYVQDQRIRTKIDKFMNCEDIAFNYMISDLTRKPPIKVTGKTNFGCKLCSQDDDVQKSLSSKGLHYERRTECINYFNLIYGYNPLLYSQARSDSVLYKASVGKSIKSCFNKI